MPASENPSQQPVNESERLRELYSLEILDTLPAERFERFTSLVADVFDVPHCCIHLIDRDWQRVLAASGEGARDVPREQSVCAHDMSVRLLEVFDTREHEIFSRNTYVQDELGMRFYAGALLRGPTGQPLGRICILGPEPRWLDGGERKRLLAFATLVEQELVFNERLAQARRELSSRLLFDFVTGVPRREEMEARLRGLVARARAEGTVLAVGMFRFLGFDEFLATYGQQAADEVLRFFAQRFGAVVGEGNLLARPDRDYMVAAAGGFASSEDAGAWAERMYAAVTAPYRVGGIERAASVKAGVSLFPADGEDAEALLYNATLAADSGAEPGLYFHAPKQRDAVRRRDRIRGKLTEALDGDGLELVFQPIYALPDRRPLGCEALARWHDEELGHVSPADFIPLAESDTRLARKLTRWVLRRACRAAVAWNADGAPGIPVGVNIAAMEFHQADFLDEVDAALEETAAPPEWLTIEITERTLIGDVAAAGRIIAGLRGRGVRCALDDFGTGYSSLSYLRRFAFNAVKLDRSFIVDIPGDATAIRLVSGIVDIGRALDMRVVAEGVEREDQLAALSEIGCDAVQGYLLCRPQAFDDVLALLKDA